MGIEVIVRTGQRYRAVDFEQSLPSLIRFLDKAVFHPSDPGLSVSERDHKFGILRKTKAAIFSRCITWFNSPRSLSC